ncbi:hypothetical protein [Zayintorquevirus viver1]|uniref:Capsid protein n=1 Tax=Paguma larvata torque teno virus TaxID=2219036 RepID=A0A348BSP5_9VIRU|nr:hypothetical protein QKL47_gp3 [Paguma larvata torque teno virus]BBE36932.1 hypothetical protein [Paguma larvata torque teno virus]
MAYYNYRRWPRRRKRRRYWHYRRRNRKWFPLRRFRRRKWVRKYRRRFSKRKRKATFWNPKETAKCIITGYTLGLMTKTGQIPFRCWQTFIDESTHTSRLILQGGGNSSRIFGLFFLWEEYKLFHNCWSKTNDGFDLARYFGTRWYLQPDRNYDYIFWWDPEWKNYTWEHFLRAHPSNLFCYKQKVFVRSQIWGRNNRTKKVFIPPPANLLNTWQFMPDWMNIPLFSWGVSLIEWNMPWNKSGYETPSFKIHVKDVTDGNYGPPDEDIIYLPTYDPGENNYIDCLLMQSDVQNPTSGSGWKKVTWANNLPYWMSMYGQNQTLDFGVWSQKEIMGIEKGGKGCTCWLRIFWPKYQVTNVQNGTHPSQGYRMLMFSSKCRVTNNYVKVIGGSGPYVPAPTTGDGCQIALLYKSYWQWGGTVWSNQEVINPSYFGPQATVKNPAKIRRGLLQPHDLQGGLITNQAWERLTAPKSPDEERSNLPFETATKSIVEETSSEESETPTGTDESDEEEDIEETVRALRKQLGRHKQRQRRFERLFYRLKPKRTQSSLLKREGMLPSPPKGGPPSHFQP